MGRVANSDEFCAKVVFLPLGPKFSTDLDLTLIYILKLAREHTANSHGPGKMKASAPAAFEGRVFRKRLLSFCEQVLASTESAATSEYLLPAAATGMLERWPHVCRVKTMFGLLLMNWFASTSTKTNSQSMWD